MSMKERLQIMRELLKRNHQRDSEYARNQMISNDCKPPQVAASRGKQPQKGKQ